MKRTFKLTIILYLISGLLKVAAGEDYTKTIRKSWTKSSITAMKISNKFGDVKINDMGGDSVSVKVVITIENASASKAKDLMNKITVEFDKTGSTAIATTIIEENFRGNNSFKIDYFVNIPKDRDLDISNKYGNLVLNELDAKGNFDVNYGNMTAGNMKAPAGNPIKLSVGYGKADLESINEAVMDIKYSKLIADKIGNLELECKYSTVSLNEVKSCMLDSKYDEIQIDELVSLKSLSKYTNYRIGVLYEDFTLDSGYGSIRIDKVDAKFKQIKIDSSYGGLNIGMEGLNYKLESECHYCEVDYPQSRFKGNRIKDNQTSTIEGTVGNGGGTVTINSRYGSIKLGE